MAKANFKLVVDMNIELPEGDTEITEQEKCAIIDRIHHYLTEIGTTSDDYEGCLAGKIGSNGPEFDLSVEEDVPAETTRKYYFPTNGDDIATTCTEECKLYKGIMIGSVICQECKHFIHRGGGGGSEYCEPHWIKCRRLNDAIG